MFTDAAQSDQFDRLPPQDLNAEQCTIGALILAGNDQATFAEVRTIISADDFYRSDHATLFQAIEHLRRTGKPVDAVTLRDELIRAKEWDNIGGVAYIGELLNSVPSAAHAMHYAKIVRDKSIGRTIIAIAGRTLSEAFAPTGIDFEYRNLLAKASSEFAIAAARGSGLRIRRLAEIEADCFEALTDGRNPPMMETGLASLDDCIGGMPIGGFTQIWARPSVGKSAFARAIAMNLARGGTPIGVITLEETEEKIANNIVSNEANIESWRLMKRQVNAEDRAKYLAAANAHFNWPLFIAPEPIKLSEVESAATLLVARHGCRALIVDHVHLIDGEPGKNDNRTNEVTKISGSLKQIGRRNGIAMIACCQLKRNTSGGMEHPPTLDSVRDSGALEQDGDLIIGLHREDLNREPENFDDQLLAIVLKNKFGKTGRMPFLWNGDYQRISEWIPKEARGDTPAQPNFF